MCAKSDIESTKLVVMASPKGPGGPAPLPYFFVTIRVKACQGPQIFGKNGPKYVKAYLLGPSTLKNMTPSLPRDLQSRKKYVFGRPVTSTNFCYLSKIFQKQMIPHLKALNVYFRVTGLAICFGLHRN